MNKELLELQSKNAIIDFTGEHSYLSNSYLCNIEYDNICFCSVEHAFQFIKTSDYECKNKIKHAPTPALAKKYGSQSPIVDGWGKIRLDIMYDLLKIKFKDIVLVACLLRTGSRIIVDGNTDGENYWGAFIKNNKVIGKNKLGMMLIKLRRRFRHEYYHI
jgi:ribA/ribD-fused uncharacterized protein